jgi:hypothetical protein
VFLVAAGLEERLQLEQEKADDVGDFFDQWESRGILCGVADIVYVGLTKNLQEGCQASPSGSVNVEAWNSSPVNRGLEPKELADTTRCRVRSHTSP